MQLLAEAMQHALTTLRLSTCTCTAFRVSLTPQRALQCLSCVHTQVEVYYYLSWESGSHSRTPTHWWWSIRRNLGFSVLPKNMLISKSNPQSSDQMTIHSHPTSPECQSKNTSLSQKSFHHNFCRRCNQVKLFNQLGPLPAISVLFNFTWHAH